MKKKCTTLALSILLALGLAPSVFNSQLSQAYADQPTTTTQKQYKVVNSLDTLDSSKNYVIVFANSSQALSGTTTSNFAVQPVDIQGVRGQSGYVTVSPLENDSTLSTYKIASAGDGSGKYTITDSSGNKLTLAEAAAINIDKVGTNGIGNTWSLSKQTVTQKEVTETVEGDGSSQSGTDDTNGADASVGGTDSGTDENGTTTVTKMVDVTNHSYLYYLNTSGGQEKIGVVAEDNSDELGQLWSEYYSQIAVWQQAQQAQADSQSAVTDAETAAGEAEEDYINKLERYIYGYVLEGVYGIAHPEQRFGPGPGSGFDEDHPWYGLKDDCQNILDKYDNYDAKIQTVLNAEEASYQAERQYNADKSDKKKQALDTARQTYLEALLAAQPDAKNVYNDFKSWIQSDEAIEKYDTLMKEYLENQGDTYDEKYDSLESRFDYSDDEWTISWYKTLDENLASAQQAYNDANAAYANAVADLDTTKAKTTEEWNKLCEIGQKLTDLMKGDIYGYSQVVQSGATNVLILEEMDDASQVTPVNDTETTYTPSLSTETEQQPEDTEFTSTTGPQQDTETYTEDETPLSGEDVNYASDAATSQIEQIFRTEDTSSNRSTTQAANNGRVITDKSVVYGSDDYNAFTTYGTGDFSVTLSALGQDYEVGADEVEDAIDVVFLLDLSQSMTNYTDPDKNTTETRWQASVDAINASMAQIMEKNPNNRVGLVCFSNTAATVLPLGSYTADDNKFITYETPSNFYSDDEALINDMKTLQTAASLKDADGNPSENANKLFTSLGATFFEQTYTQRGLQEAYNVFNSVTDTTIPVQQDENGNALTSVTRQPVLVMVTDGDPTLATYNYTDPASGPDYGDGFSYGIEGYYTILSANYFKNMISSHYENGALVYTVGLGIKDSGHSNYRFDREEELASKTTDELFDEWLAEHYTVNENGSLSEKKDVTENAANKAHDYSGIDTVDDAYRRAVLDPSSGNVNELINIEGLSAYLRTADTNQTLYNLLTGKEGSGFTQDVKPIKNSYETDGLGYTAMTLRGTENPYSNYDYVDASYFGNLSESDLEGIFSDIVTGMMPVNNSMAPLKKDTSLTVTDPLGESMEVKGVPVLRYNGENIQPDSSTPTTITRDGVTEDTYTWTLDEGTITAAVVTVPGTTQTDGQQTQATQTVRMNVPDSLLPTFHKALTANFYYEELPVRLIYQVGLTNTEKENLAAQSDYSESYLTNRYDATTGNASAQATFIPASENPYYSNGANSQVSTKVAKEESPTSTAANARTETYGINTSGNASVEIDTSTLMVTQELGNNGTLQLDKVTVPLTATKTVDSHAPAAANAYTFVLKDFDTKDVLQTKTNGTTAEDGSVDAGTVTFDSLVFDKEDTYTYLVEELPGTDAAMSYDTSVYKVTVEVKRNDAGALEATTTYDKQESEDAFSIDLEKQYSANVVTSLAFENTSKTTTLKLTKNIGGGVPAGATDADTFGFTITLKDENGNLVNATYNADGNTYTFTGGKYHVDLAGNNSLEIPGIPYGYTYEITEDSPEQTSGAYAGYVLQGIDINGTETTNNGNMLQGENAKAAGTVNSEHTNVTFSNGPATTDESLVVEKKVTNAPANSTDTFTLNVKLYYSNGTSLPSGYTYTLNNETTKRTYDADKGIDLTLTANSYAVINNLSENLKYEITETSYTGTYSESLAKETVEGTMANSGEDKKVWATFTNKYTTGKSLTLKKQVDESSDVNPDTTYTFAVTLRNGEASNYLTNVLYESDPHISKTSEGHYTVTLKAGEEATFMGLPANYRYYIQEVDTQSANNVKIVSAARSAVDENGTALSKDQFTAAGALTVLNFANGANMPNAATITYTNTANLSGNLEVSKKVEGTNASTADSFPVTVTLYSDEGHTQVNTAVNGKYGNMTFENGVATFEIKANQTVVATGLPRGAYYTVKEDSKDYTARYSVDGTALTQTEDGTEPVAAGTIAEGQTSTVAITNHRDAVVVLQARKVLDGAPLTAGKFTFELKDSAGNVLQAKNDENGLVSFEVPLTQAGQTYTCTISEVNDGQKAITSYDASVFNATATLSSDGKVGVSYTKDGAPVQEMVFKNTQTTKGSLEVSKEITGSGASSSDEFSYEVSLYNDDAHTEVANITGTYGDMEFVDGVATFKLKGGTTKTAEGLPENTYFNVKETDALDYTCTTYLDSSNLAVVDEYGENSDNASGMIEAAETHAVKFVNNKYAVKTAIIKAQKIMDGASLSGYEPFTFVLKEYNGDDDENSATGRVVQTATSNYAGEVTFEVPFSMLEDEHVYTISEVKGTDQNVVYDKTIYDVQLCVETDENWEPILQDPDGEPDSGDEYYQPVVYYYYHNDFEGPNDETGNDYVTFTNTAKTGSIALSKSTLGSTPKRGYFTYQVVIKNAKGDPIYGKLTEDGPYFYGATGARVSVAAGSTYNIEGIPYGCTYEITEVTGISTPSGYYLQSIANNATLISNGGAKLTEDQAVAQGTIHSEQVNVAFTNAQSSLDSQLYVGKHVRYALQGDTTKFDIQVKLKNVDGSDYSGTYSLVKLNSSAETDLSYNADSGIELSLGNDEYVGIGGLPEGTTYEVTEPEVPNGYTLKSEDVQSGTIGQNPSWVTVVNNSREGFERSGEGNSLLLEKKLSESSNVDSNTSFQFDVLLLNEDGGVLEDEPSYTETASVEKGEGGHYTVTMKAGEHVEFTGLPTYYSYRVTEVDSGNADYQQTSNIDVQITDRATGEASTNSFASKNRAMSMGAIDESPEIVFTNTTVVTGSLEVSKAVSGSAASANDEFPYKVTLSDTSINGEYGGMTFENGVATFSLKDGQSVVAEGLPQGTQYSVEETDTLGYTASVNGAQGTSTTGTIEARTTQTAAFVNSKTTTQPNTGSLTIAKAVVGENLAEIPEENLPNFAFKVELKQADGTAFTGGLQTASGEEVTFENGEAVVEVKAGKSVEINNIPYGCSYQISELSHAENTNVAEGYFLQNIETDNPENTQQSNKGGELTGEDAIAKGSINQEQTHVKFTNAPDVAAETTQLIVEKKLNNANFDYNTAFKLVVKLKQATPAGENANATAADSTTNSASESSAGAGTAEDTSAAANENSQGETSAGTQDGAAATGGTGEPDADAVSGNASGNTSGNADENQDAANISTLSLVSSANADELPDYVGTYSLDFGKTAQTYNADTGIVLNLANEEYAAISGLPEGVTYEITEIDIPEGYEAVTEAPLAGSIGAENAWETFVNKRVVSEEPQNPDNPENPENPDNPNTPSQKNPTVTTAEEPSATPDTVVANSGSEESSEGIADTGDAILPIVIIGAALVIGAVAIVVARRRSKR